MHAFESSENQKAAEEVIKMLKERIGPKIGVKITNITGFQLLDDPPSKPYYEISGKIAWPDFFCIDFTIPTYWPKKEQS